MSPQGNTCIYDAPKTMPNGLYRYHSHRHTVTAEQTHFGLAGLLEIGRPDGNLPIVTQNDILLRHRAAQCNYARRSARLAIRDRGHDAEGGRSGLGVGYFLFPTQTLLRAALGNSGQRSTTALEPGQNLDA